MNGQVLSIEREYVDRSSQINDTLGSGRNELPIVLESREAFRMFISVAGPQLSSLHIENWEPGRDDAGMISATLQPCLHLKRLGLINTKLCDDAIQALTEQRSWMRVADVQFGWNQFSHAAIHKLKRFFTDPIA